MTPRASDLDAIRAHIAWLGHREHGCAEVRVISNGPTLVGFFDDTGALLRAVVGVSSGNVYVGVQPRPVSLLARSPNRLSVGVRGASADEIETLTTVMLDVDPVRAEGMSKQAATDAELEHALDAARLASDWLAAEGYLRPAIAMSGNGAQLLLRVPSAPLDTDDRDALEHGLRLFEAEVRTHVDRLGLPVRMDRTSDLPRIGKLIGSVSRKGDGAGDRPHRVSRWLELPDTEPDDRLLRHVIGLGQDELRRIDDARRARIEALKQREANRAPPTAGAMSVVERCRRYLERREPAVQGSNGSGAMLGVARVIFHGFALSESEGWSLLCEWNQTHAAPPFDESDKARPADSLRRKMRQAMSTPLPSGFGWREMGELRERPPPKRERVEPKTGANRVAQKQRASARDDDYGPPPEAYEDQMSDDGDGQSDRGSEQSNSGRRGAAGKPVVYLAHHPDQPYRELHAIIDDAAKVLGERADVYCRDGSLVDVGSVDVYLGRDRDNPRKRRTGKALGIRQLPTSETQRHLSAVADWRAFRYSKARKEYVEVPTDPPMSLATSVANMGRWSLVRPLAGVSDAPSMRPDGSLIQSPGWDEATGYLYAPTIEYPMVPELLTQEDAARALAQLRQVFAAQTSERAGFPFASDADALVPIAALFTLVGRPAIDGPVPAFLFDAPTPASGKTLLADLVCLIATGHELPKGTFPESAEELEKMLGGYALQGARVVGFDNVDQRIAFRGAPLDKVLTGSLVQLRVLGRSETPMLTWSAVVIATGNNVQVLGDTIRRTLRCRVEPDVERPEERDGFAIDDIRGHVKERRGELVAAALTVLRAYQVAGCPATGAKRLGSFEDWQRTVASAIAWAGGTDVLECRCDVDDGDDPELDGASTLLQALHRLGPMCAGDLIAAGYDWETDYQGVPRPDSARCPDIKDALDALVPKRDKTGRPSAKATGWALKRLRGRVHGGLKLDCRRGAAGGMSVEWLAKPSSNGARQRDGSGVSGDTGVSAPSFARAITREVSDNGGGKTPEAPETPPTPRNVVVMRGPRSGPIRGAS